MDLKRRQELYLDGIETSLVMTRISYARLYSDVECFSREEDQNSLPTSSQVQILLDAWSLVDTINRLRILIPQTPGLKKNIFVDHFQKETNSIEEFRHFAQHLRREIPKLEDTGWPLWGSLSWIYESPEMQTQKLVKIFVIIPGRLAKSGGYPAVNPVGLRIEPPVDHIRLTVGTSTIDLSDLFRNTIQFEARVSAAVSREKEGKKNNSLEPGIMQIVLEE